jgi:hypothetical protein
MAGPKSRMFRTIPLMIAICLLSVSVYAKYSGGTGEPNDPYQIATADDLIALGEDANDYDKNFILTADIDLDPNLPGGRVFDDALIAPDETNGVGAHSGPSFRGVFDGQGHAIANLHVSGKHGYDAGLFGILGGLVTDVNFTDVVVSGSPCGAIAGLSLNGMILRCRVTGQVSGDEDVGGLVGSLWDAGVVDCQADVQVSGTWNVGGMVGGGPGGTLVHCEVQAQVSGQINIGGLVGQGGHDGQAVECRATGTVTGDDNVGGLIGVCESTPIWTSSANCDVSATRTAGGLVGSVHWLSGPLIADCYAQGSVAGSVVGGLAGEARFNQFLNCYAACKMIPVEIEGQPLLVGGLYGDVSFPRNAPLTVACFWDAELSGAATGAGSDALPLGTGLTTPEMQNQAVFENAGWDFDYTWTIREGQYPTLQWEGQN